MEQISGTLARGWWFNADDGTLTDLGTLPTNGTQRSVRRKRGRSLSSTTLTEAYPRLGQGCTRV